MESAGFESESDHSRGFSTIVTVSVEVKKKKIKSNETTIDVKMIRVFELQI